MNFGVRKSVYQKFKLKSPEIIKAPCMCHAIHNSIKFASERFNFKIEEFINKVYTYFSSSPVRVENIQLYCKLDGVKYKKIIKHVETRWLSLLKAIVIVNKLIDVLQEYFSSILESDFSPILIMVFCENNHNF